MAQKTVMLFGSFDILHPGHLSLFRQARKHGERLIIVIARDKTISEIKGRKPQHGETQRLEALQKLNVSDRVVFGRKKDKYAIIARYRPDIIALGYDQSHFVKGLQAFLAKNRLKVKVVRLKPYRENIYKSSKLKSQACFVFLRCM